MDTAPPCAKVKSSIQREVSFFSLLPAGPAARAALLTIPYKESHGDTPGQGRFSRGEDSLAPC
jgi:hypothetical protein